MRDRDIVCVGFSDWNNDLLTNEQHLLMRLAKDNRVLFVESLGLRRPQVATKDLRRIARRLLRGVGPPRAMDGLRVLSPLVLPLHGNPVARRANAAILPRLVSRAVDRIGMRDVLLWSFVPQAEVLLDALQPAKVLYYVDDDHAAKKGIDGPSFAAAEERFARRADAVLASAPELAERMRTLNATVEYAPNVADTELFATALDPGPPDEAVAALPHPRVVFTGAIVANKLDLDLIEQVCAARPEWSFAFVGPIGPGDPSTDVSRLRPIANLHLLGRRAYRELPAVLRAGDVAVLPYRTDGEMRSVFPMKTYEYLAAGLPVVSTDLPALGAVTAVTKAATAEAFVAALEHEMATDTGERRAERSRAAQAHSWDARIAQLDRVLYGTA